MAELRAGATAVCVTPPIGVDLAGYSGRVVFVNDGEPHDCTAAESLQHRACVSSGPRLGSRAQSRAESLGRPFTATS